MHFISSLVAVQMSVSGLILVSKLDIYSTVHHSEACVDGIPHMLYLFAVAVSQRIERIVLDV